MLGISRGYRYDRSRVVNTHPARRSSWFSSVLRPGKATTMIGPMVILFWYVCASLLLATARSKPFPEFCQAVLERLCRSCSDESFCRLRQGWSTYDEPQLCRVSLKHTLHIEQHHDSRSKRTLRKSGWSKTLPTCAFPLSRPTS